MNQVTNLVQYKNHTDDEKAGFDFENYSYKFQCGASLTWNDSQAVDIYDLHGSYVYRLKIEPGKFYVYVDEGKEIVFKGDMPYITNSPVVRPATAAEIPEPERVFKDGAFYPVIIKGIHNERMRDIAQHDNDEFVTALHTNPRCESGYYLEENFSWIGEELKIEWGK